MRRVRLLLFTFNHQMFVCMSCPGFSSSILYFILYNIDVGQLTCTGVTAMAHPGFFRVAEISFIIFSGSGDKFYNIFG